MNSRSELQPRPATQLDPGLSVEFERVDKDTVVVEDGEIGVCGLTGTMSVLFKWRLDGEESSIGEIREAAIRDEPRQGLGDCLSW